MIIQITKDLAEDNILNKIAGIYPKDNKHNLYILKTKKGNYYLMTSIELDYRNQLLDKAKEIFEND